MVQPWARKKQAGKKKSVPVVLEYRIHADVPPQSELLLGLESPHRFAIAINGRPVSSEATRGWWVDPSLKLIALDPAWLRPGENRLRLETAYTEDDGLEIIYLLGEFGVALAGRKARIIAAPERLEIGDWTEQGLPFYSGSVSYRRAVATPRLAKGERLFVRVPEYRGVAARVLVNGKEAGFIGWEPAEADITDYLEGDAFELAIELVGHRRNSHGPLHYAEKWPVFTGPWQFVSEGKDWSDAWNIVPCGLMESPDSRSGESPTLGHSARFPKSRDSDKIAKRRLSRRRVGRLRRQKRSRFDRFVLAALAVLGLFAFAFQAWANPTSQEDAANAVRGWSKQPGRGLTSPLGDAVKETQLFADAAGRPSFCVVYLKPSGFVIVPADDLVEPIIAFSPGVQFVNSDSDPLGALVRRDLPERLAAARSRPQTPAHDRRPEEMGAVEIRRRTGRARQRRAERR